MACFKYHKAPFWLSLILLMFQLVLPIGKCMAQTDSLSMDLVGLQRRNVQVLMKDYSFSEYQKSHVIYVLAGENYQRVNYQADTCSSIEFIISLENKNSFEDVLEDFATKNSIKLIKKELGGKIRFVIDQRTRPVRHAASKRTVKNVKRQAKIESSSTAMVQSDERKAADKRYFTIQKTDWNETEDQVRVLGWKKK